MHRRGLVYGGCVAEVYGDVLTDEMNRQASGLSVTEQKFAEKLVILTERGNGILIRLYNIKKVGLRRIHVLLHAVHACCTCIDPVSCPRQACQDPQNRPSFLSEKPLESAIKHLVRKFPVAETKVSAKCCGRGGHFVVCTGEWGKRRIQEQDGWGGDGRGGDGVMCMM